MKKSAGCRHTVPMTESLSVISFLALSGGLQDAYTYAERGGVFANAQTGNIVLLSVSLLEGEGSRILRYLIPLFFFSMGILTAEFIRTHVRSSGSVLWRQGVLLCEIILLFIVGLFPAGVTVPANALVSFACAMQVQTFRKVDGLSFSSTMCIGDLRSGMEALYAWHLTREQETLSRAGRYFAVILLFALGAGLGGLAVPFLGTHTIWLSCIFLSVCFLLLFNRSR